MSQVNITDVKKLQTYTSDKSFIGIIVTVIVAVVILIVAFFMNIVKWVLLFIAVMLFITVGVRIYQKMKEVKKT